MNGFAGLEQDLLAQGLVDTHYHIGPELLPRRYDVKSLAEAAREWNPTVVLKNHTYATTPLAALARAHFGARFLGSVVLNRFVGGLNPDAVLGAVSGNRTDVQGGAGKELPVVVWMPTVHAESHLRVLGRAFDPRWHSSAAAASDPANDSASETPVPVFDGDLRPVRQLSPVLEAIAATGSILATGHLAAPEIMRLVPMALEAGIRRVILTHPHYPSVQLSDDQLRQLASDERVFIEHCFAIHTIEKVPLEDIAESIRVTGPEQVVLSTDFGQIRSQPFPEGTLTYAGQLSQLVGDHVGRSWLVRMFTSNGARALSVNDGE